MAYRENEVTNDRGPSSRQIRNDIESTRREMDRNLDALESKLTPTQLAMEAWGLFRGGFWETMEERPLALGAAAIALGVVAGLMIPSTRKEDELMGETRDRLMERAKEVGGEALEKGKQVAHVAVDTLKEEAERQDLTPEKLVEKVRTVAKEATNTVKEEGKRQASELKETVKGDTTAGVNAGIEQPEPELSRKY